MNTERTFTLVELRKYNGEDSPIYVAHNGIVYDVTECPKWRKGLHEGLHFPGQDLSTEIKDSPHSEAVFRRPCVKRVGILSFEIEDK